MALRANANWSRNCACTWHGAGSQVWGSIRRFRITRRSRRTGTVVSKSRSCLSSCSSRLCGSVWKWDWCRASSCRSMAVSWRPNASKESRIPREQLAEAAQVNHTVRQYLREVEEQNPVEEPVHEQDQVSTTDPDSTYATKGGTPARLGYYDNYLVDNDSCVIVGVQATAARMSQETVAAEDMLTRFAEWQEREPESVGADTTYGNGEFLQWLADRNITPYMRTRDSIHRKRSPFFGPERFTYEPEHNRYICPAGQPLNYGGQTHRNHSWTYIGTRKRCGPCELRPQCTSSAFRGLVIHQNEPARQRARELANTPEFAKAQRQRKKVEALFAELKNQIGLRRLRLRRLKFVREQFFLAAAAQNIKRLVRFLSQPTTPTVEAAT